MDHAISFSYPWFENWCSFTVGSRRAAQGSIERWEYWGGQQTTPIWSACWWHRWGEFVFILSPSPHDFHLCGFVVYTCYQKEYLIFYFSFGLIIALFCILHTQHVKIFGCDHYVCMYNYILYTVIYIIILVCTVFQVSYISPIGLMRCFFGGRYISIL